jgi:hypothetical protein
LRRTRRKMAILCLGLIYTGRIICISAGSDPAEILYQSGIHRVLDSQDLMG